MPTPVINITTQEGRDFKTNIDEQIILGTVTASDSAVIKVNGSTSSDITRSGNIWKFKANLSLGDNTYVFVVTDGADTSTPVTIKVTLISSFTLGVRVTSPTGVETESYSDNVTVHWLGNVDVFTVNNEKMILSGSIPTNLTNSGVLNLDSVMITSNDTNPAARTLYKNGRDYIVITPDVPDFPSKIQRVVGGSIQDNSEVLITYQIEKTDVNINGYNIYGSVDPGGGIDGYKKLNTSIIATPSGMKEFLSLKDLTVREENSIRTSIRVERVTNYYKYSYKLTDFNFQTRKNSSDLTTYFVITAVVFDSTSRTEIESLYSSEVSAKPITINATIVELVPRSRQDIAISSIDTISQTHSDIDMKPNTVTRDIFIDPPSNEIEKIYYRLDYINKAQSFITLLNIDDPDNTGVSQANTFYKEALRIAFGYTSIDEVQEMIDNSFTKLAANFGITRYDAQKAVGEVLVYSSSRPTKTVDIVVGSSFTAKISTGQVKFVSLNDVFVTTDQVGSYLNPITQRYEFPINIMADIAGSTGEVDADIIKIGAPSGYYVTNPKPTRFGYDKESNRSLAERSMVAMMGVDTGTVGGYIREAQAHPGVLRVSYQMAGDSAMFRDFDSVRNKNVGGKVDLYVQGSKFRVFEDKFSVYFPIISEEPASVDNTTMLRVKINNFKVTSTTPVSSVTRVVNLTKGADYSLTGVTFLANLITLDSTNVTNRAIGMDVGDSIKVSYTYREITSHVFIQQPVNKIISITGDVSGDLSSNYNFYSTEDPLQEGRSALAGDKLVMRFALDSNTNINKPLDILSEYDETVIFSAKEIVTLSRVGIVSDSIEIKSTDNIISYNITRDFDIIDKGSSESSVKLARKTGSTIPDGATVKVKYKAGETIVVRYEVNDLIESLQDIIDKKEYATADVLVKEAIPIPVDIATEIVLSRDANPADVDARIRTKVARFFDTLRIGDSVAQSDIIRIIDEVRGVNTFKVPLIKLARAENSLVVLDNLLINSWSLKDNNDYKSYISDAGSQSALTYSTIDGGGNILSLGTNAGNKYRTVGVYSSGKLYKSVDTIGEVAKNVNSSYISVESGIAKIVVSTSDGNPPLPTSKWQANYYIYGESGTKDITSNKFEYLVLGNLALTYKF